MFSAHCLQRNFRLDIWAMLFSGSRQLGLSSNASLKQRCHRTSDLNSGDHLNLQRATKDIEKELNDDQLLINEFGLTLTQQLVNAIAR